MVGKKVGHLVVQSLSLYSSIHRRRLSCCLLISIFLFFYHIPRFQSTVYSLILSRFNFDWLKLGPTSALLNLLHFDESKFTPSPFCVNVTVTHLFLIMILVKTKYITYKHTVPNIISLNPVSSKLPNVVYQIQWLAALTCQIKSRTGTVFTIERIIGSGLISIYEEL